IGIFYPFLNDSQVRLIGAEAGGKGLDTNEHAATLSMGSPGVFQGSMSYLLQSSSGQVQPAHSVSAGLDYPAVGPEHAYLKDSGRVEYAAVTDKEALEALHVLSRIEGIIPALESSHALAQCVKLSSEISKDHLMIVNISGRGDKDMDTIMKHSGGEVH
ncbi:tryptophan synthase subunit beta, partial [Klebsiella pneumoniae]|nr:tryptophan synthase subunit beta [Klebsiella pneumoniae]